MKFLMQDYVRYGLTMSGVIIICLAVMEFTGQNKNFDKSPIVFFFTVIAPFIIWFLGIAALKRLQKGKLTFRQGLAEGFKISLVYGLTSPFVFLFYYLYVNPPIVEYVREVYRMNGAPDSVVIATDLTVQVVAAIIGGTIYAAIISFFLKNKKK